MRLAIGGSADPATAQNTVAIGGVKHQAAPATPLLRPQPAQFRRHRFLSASRQRVPVHQSADTRPHRQVNGVIAANPIHLIKHNARRAKAARGPTITSRLSASIDTTKRVTGGYTSHGVARPYNANP